MCSIAIKSMDLTKIAAFIKNLHRKSKISSIRYISISVPRY